MLVSSSFVSTLNFLRKEGANKYQLLINMKMEILLFFNPLQIQMEYTISMDIFKFITMGGGYLILNKTTLVLIGRHLISVFFVTNHKPI